MSIYKSYKQGNSIKQLTESWGVRKTFNSLKRALGRSLVRIKHNKIQTLNKKGVWTYLT